MLKGCKSFGKYCEADLEVLRALGEEPRDRAWAKRMESKIRARVMSKEPGKYSIRALECRTSLCAAEVVSHFGSYYSDYPAGDPDLSFSRGVAFGREFDQSSWTPLTITLVLYWRYASDSIPE